MRSQSIGRYAAWIAVLFFVVGCATISPYSPTAYEQATSLKVESLALMDKAAEPFASHKKEVDELRLSLEKAYEYSSGRPKNGLSSAQWEIIKDPARNSIGGFLKRWEEKSTLSSDFIIQAKDIVSDGFDQVIGLESGKIKPTGE